MASAAVNALRLHQRIPRISLSAQTFQNILAEDSGHYLAFSLMFLSARQRFTQFLAKISPTKTIFVDFFQDKIDLTRLQGVRTIRYQKRLPITYSIYGTTFNICLRKVIGLITTPPVVPDAIAKIRGSHRDGTGISVDSQSRDCLFPENLKK